MEFDEYFYFSTKKMKWLVNLYSNVDFFYDVSKYRFK